MSVVRDVRRSVTDDIARARKIWLPWWAVLCLFVVGVPTLWLFAHLDRVNLFLPAFNAAGMLAITVAAKWNLRRRVWFWATIAILAALHIPLVMLTPWTTKWIPALAIAAIDSADIIVMFTILAIVGWMLESETPRMPQ